MYYRPALFISIVSLAIVYTAMVYTGSAGSRGELASPAAQQGKLLYQRYNCTACHQLYGLGGYMGPDLTNVMTAKGKGELYVRAILQTGTSRMPDFHLQQQEIEALAAYLAEVSSSGRYPVAKPRWRWWGDLAPEENEKP